MNIQYLRYALEVEKTRSINRAAENLYMAQPNLSRAIRELEKSIGITIFRRSARGIAITYEGEEFLADARRILAEIDRVEARYRSEKQTYRRFSVTGPRSSVFAAVFSQFAQKLGEDAPPELRYRETNPMSVMDDVQQGFSQLGILRFQKGDERAYWTELNNRELEWRQLLDWTPLLTVPRESPLAQKAEVTEADLVNGVEICLADVNAPTVRLNSNPKVFIAERKMYAYDRASRMELLKAMPGAFMWEDPIPSDIRERFGICQQACSLEHRIFRDVLICRRDHRFGDLEELFLEELEKQRLEMGIKDSTFEQ